MEEGRFAMGLDGIQEDEVIEEDSDDEEEELPTSTPFTFKMEAESQLLPQPQNKLLELDPLTFK